jgi:hypothetical protein
MRIQSAQSDKEEGGKVIEDPRLLPAGYQLAHRLYSPIKFRKETSAIWEAIGCPAGTGTVPYQERRFSFTVVPVLVSWITVEYRTSSINRLKNSIIYLTLVPCCSGKCLDKIYFLCLIVIIFWFKAVFRIRTALILVG